jgi:hypothetical protein
LNFRKIKVLEVYGKKQRQSDKRKKSKKTQDLYIATFFGGFNS